MWGESLPVKTRTFSLIAVLAVVVLVVVTARIIAKDRHDKQAQTQFDPRYPYGRDGRDLRHAGQTMDMMAQTIHDHIQLAAVYCEKHHIQGAERSKIITDTFKAGMEAQKQVAASNYTVPFEPHYPPLSH
jgi:hypothetical protein